MHLAIIDPGLRKARFLLQVAAKLEPEIRCVYFSKRRIVSRWIKSAGGALFPDGRRSLSRLELSDEELRAAVGRKELERRKGAVLKAARAQVSELASFFETCRPDAVLLWNGSNLLVSLATHLARRHGLPVIFAEHGYLPDTLQIDSQGVNFASSLTSLVLRGTARMSPNAAIDTALDAAIACYRAGRPPRAVDRNPPAHIQADLLSRVGMRVAARVKHSFTERLWRQGRSLGLDAALLPERYLLVPLQVRKDSQLLLHSPLVKNDLERFLTLVQNAATEVDPQLKIVVKFHPREQLHVQRRNLQLLRRFPAIAFVSKPPMRDLLKRAAAVVTINSTVGFEAFLYDKPVVTLGRNFYTVPKLVEVVNAEHEMKDALARALSSPVRSRERREFLRYVYARFLVHGSYNDYSPASIAAVADRIHELLGVSAGPHASTRKHPIDKEQTVLAEAVEA